MMHPKTPLETGGDWATLLEEQAFLERIANDTNRLTLHVVGTTPDGLPYGVAVVGNPAPDSFVDVKGVMIVASQHGFEPSAREAALRTIRDLAYTDDPNVLSAISDHPVAFIYNANPYGSKEFIRRNSLGQDPNRFHVSLKAPESRLLNEVLAAVDPVFVYDGHDTVARPDLAQLYFVTWSLLAAPAYQVWDEQFRTALASEFSDITTHLYTLDRSEGTLTNALASRGIPNCLYETLVTEPDEDRVTRHVRAMKHAIVYAHQNRVQLEQVKAESQHHYRQEGFTAHSLVQVGPDNFQQAPVGYRVAESQEMLEKLHIFGVKSAPDGFIGTELYVPMDQPMSPILPWLFDPRAPSPIVEGIPLFDGDGPGIDHLNDPDGRFLPTEVRAGVGTPRRIVGRDGIVWGT